jgi:hypothetical protein
MKPHHIARFLGVAVLTTWALAGAVAPAASAQSCPDVDVLFARGTGDPPGVGPTGEAFVNSLRPQVNGRSFEVYPVSYPASRKFDTAIDGVGDAIAHVASMAVSCPKTKMVLGGYSQGAAVMGFVTSPVIPERIDPATAPQPLAPEAADHVAAVVLFGTPNARFMKLIGKPPVVIGPLYEAKTIELCVPDDPVCSQGLAVSAHRTYATDGIVQQGATFAASRLSSTFDQNAPPPTPVAPAPGPPPPGEPEPGDQP